MKITYQDNTQKRKKLFFGKTCDLILLSIYLQYQKINEKKLLKNEFFNDKIIFIYRISLNIKT